MNIFYLIFIMLTAYYSFRYDRIEEYDPHKQHRLWLICFYLICLSGFSYGLGGDKFAYMEYFEDYPTTFSETSNFVWLQFLIYGHMPLWTLLNIFAKVVFNSFYAVQFIESILINIAVCYLVSKYTHRYFLFLLVYFFSLQFFIFNTEVMREGCAMAFMLIGMHGWLINKKWLFFLCLPIAFLFHVSVVAALLLPFANFRVTRNSLFYGVALSFFVWLLSDLILARIMFSVLGGRGAMVQKVLTYAIMGNNIFGYARSVITYLIFPFIIMYSVIQNEEDSEKRRLKEKMLAYTLIMGIMASSFTGLIRLYNYTRIFYLIMLSDLIYTLFQQKKHLIIRCTTLMGTIFLIALQYMIPYRLTNTHYYDFFYPYTCILHEDKSVYIRDIAHKEAVIDETEDDNVRDIE